VKKRTVIFTADDFRNAESLQPNIEAKYSPDDYRPAPVKRGWQPSKEAKVAIGRMEKRQAQQATAQQEAQRFDEDHPTQGIEQPDPEGVDVPENQNGCDASENYVYWFIAFYAVVFVGFVLWVTA